MTISMILLGLLWLAWCVIHSALISTSLMEWLEGHFPRLLPPHRLVYNCFSLATLLPLVLLTRHVMPEPVFSWTGPAVVVRIVLLACAVALFHGGAQRYDLSIFLGIRQLRGGHAQQLLSEREGFAAGGVFGLTRHPWYLGSLLFIWSALPEYSAGMLLAAVILSGYLVVGTWLEEQKILAHHPVAYRRYSQQVSMLFPWRWLHRKWSEMFDRGGG